MVYQKISDDMKECTLHLLTESWELPEIADVLGASLQPCAEQCGARLFKLQQRVTFHNFDRLYTYTLYIQMQNQNPY